MNTTATYKYSLHGELAFAGDAPIFGGNMTFSTFANGTDTCVTAATFAKEILFADLELESGNYNFRIESDASTGLRYINNDPVLNIAGDTLEQFTEIEAIYIETNATVTISGIFSTLPTALSNNGILFLQSVQAGDAIVAEGDTVFQLSFSAASVAAIGQSNLRARVVILGTL